MASHPRPAGGGPDTDGAPDRSASPGSRALWILPALLLAALWASGRMGGIDRGELGYTAFKEHVRRDAIQEVTLRGSELRGTTSLPIGDRDRGAGADTAGGGTPFMTRVPAFGGDALLELLEAEDVELRVERETPWTLLLWLFLPLLMVGWIWFAGARQMQQGRQLLGFGRREFERRAQPEQQSTFDDVAGAEAAKTELAEIVEFLRDPGKFRRLGGRPPKGVLLVGAPGTGKTLLARAVAGEAGVTFFSLTGSDFMELFVGVGAARVRQLFRTAHAEAPGIIFIDELDSIGRRRGAGLGGGHDEREQTLNQLLSEMDGFEVRSGVVVLAATNRPDILDPALLRPGRFDRQVTIELPPTRAREAILRLHAGSRQMAADADLAVVARQTPGFSGADLENLVNEAALLAARNDRDAIGQPELEEARDKIILGLRREGLTLSDEERRVLAVHEAGHAVVAALRPRVGVLHRITIVPRGRSMGVTHLAGEDDRYVHTREYLLDQLAVLVGGRAAEELFGQTKTSGAADDLQRATNLARKMVREWGMSERLGLMALGDGHEQVFLGAEIARPPQSGQTTADEIDQEVRELLEGVHAWVMDTLRQYEDVVLRIVDELLEHEDVSGDFVRHLVAGERHPRSGVA